MVLKWGRPKGVPGKLMSEATKDKIRAGVKAAYLASLSVEEREAYLAKKAKEGV